MKYLLFKSIVLCSLLSLPIIGQAQSCRGFHAKKCAPDPKSGMVYDPQSKSALFAPGYSSDLHIVAYKGNDYRVSFCLDKHLGEQVLFQIIDDKTKDVLYDNADDNYSQEFKFSSINTQKLVLKITIPDGSGGSTGGGKIRKVGTEDLHCLGVLVEKMGTPNLGF